LERKSITEALLCKLKAIKGVEETYILDEEEREKILQLEKDAEGMVLMGLGQGDNQGVKEVFKRQVIVAFTTNMDYVWPEGPNVVLMQYGEKVGEDVYDEEKLEEYKQNKDILVMGNFILYKNAVPKGIKGKQDPLKVVLPPQNCQAIEMPGIKNIVLGSPSTPSDGYIRSRMGLTAAKGQGTFLVGFDLS